MGSVYLAERADGEIQQRVAVKLLRADGHRPVWRDRFLKERQLLASLHHPSVVHVIDAGHTARRPALSRHGVCGRRSHRSSTRLGSMFSDRLKLFLRVCEGVSHAHRHLIIHRDLKPSNILVDASGQPKLLDFGIAKLLDETGDATQTVERLLTPNYASPEQLSGRSADYRDRRLLAGRGTLQIAHRHGAARAELRRRLKAEIAPPSQLNPDVPQGRGLHRAKGAARRTGRSLQFGG